MGSLLTGDKSEHRPPRRRGVTAVMAVLATIAALLAVGGQPSAAATTKTLNASCGGADAKTASLLKTVGDGSLTAPFTIKADAPPFVEPGQTGVPFSLTLSLSLPQETVDLIAGLSPVVKVKNVKAPLVVTGPTSTKVVNATLPDLTLNLQKGKPFAASFPPVKGVINDVGNSGLIRVATNELTFTVQLTAGPLTDPLNLRCTTGATVLSLPVKVAGSPNIVQPIVIETVEGQPSTIDVLGKHVSNGTTKDGVEQQVDPSTLKIIDGDAQVVGGNIVAVGPPAGQTSEVTFEVCAGTIKIADADPGTTEVQEIRLFFNPNTQALKREFGSRFAFGGEPGNDVAWSVDFVPVLAPEPELPKVEELESGEQSAWQKFLGGHIQYLALQHHYPTAAEMQAALESIPAIGPGNVKVTQGAVVTGANAPEGVTLDPGTEYMPYTVEFSGDLALKALDQIGVANLYSFLPVEIKNSLIGLLNELPTDEGGGEGGEGEPPAEEPTPIPEGLSVKEYVDQLSAKAGYLGSIGDIVGQIETIQLMLKVVGENLMDLIDIAAVTQLINDIFQSSPGVVTVTQGADPTPEKFQELCAQGIITLQSPANVAEIPDLIAQPGAAVKENNLTVTG